MKFPPILIVVYLVHLAIATTTSLHAGLTARGKRFWGTTAERSVFRTPPIALELLKQHFGIVEPAQALKACILRSRFAGDLLNRGCVVGCN
jgi:hypothetical protein